MSNKTKIESLGFRNINTAGGSASSRAYDSVVWHLLIPTFASLFGRVAFRNGVTSWGTLLQPSHWSSKQLQAS